MNVVVLDEGALYAETLDATSATFVQLVSANDHTARVLFCSFAIGATAGSAFICARTDFYTNRVDLTDDIVLDYPMMAAIGIDGTHSRSWQTVTGVLEMDASADETLLMRALVPAVCVTGMCTWSMGRP